MPHYYFDVRDGDGTFVDDVGLELPDMDTAVREARKAIADMVRDALREADGDLISILVRDGADGPVLISVKMTTDDQS
jgi:cobalamin biosynthesis protein CbiD